MHLHPPPRAYFLPRTIYHDGEPTTLERALRRGADPTALMVDDGNGGRRPYMRLTQPQFAFLAGLVDTYEHGATAITGRGAMRIASSLDTRKLAGVLEATEPGEPDEVATCFVFLASADASYMTGQVLHPNGGEIVNT